MTEEVKKIEVITVDGEQYKVEEMGEEVQKVVRIFDNWNKKDVDLQNEIAALTSETQATLNDMADNLAMIRAAKDTLSRQILEKIKEKGQEREVAKEEVAEVE